MEYDGLGLADLVKKKKISPRELVKEAIRRIKALNPAGSKINMLINAVLYLSKLNVFSCMSKIP